MGRRHVVITDGASAIGAATARRFVAQGDRVTVMARVPKDLDVLADELGVRPVRIDVGDPASVEAAFMAAGPADVLVNSAEMLKGGALTATNVRTWEEILKVNLTGAYLCSLKVLPYMISKKNGRIVNLSATAGLKGYKNMVATSAAQHGLVGFTRALADEVAEHGITVNAVCPGFVDSPETQGLLAAMAEKLGRPVEEIQEEARRRSPQGRLIAVDEVVGAIVYLASEDARGVSGQCLSLCGGELNV